jgi:predicted TIM-barrel fold metal-dependent hydrolase
LKYGFKEVQQMINKVIDLCLSLPRTEDQILKDMTELAKNRGGIGMANYRNIFGEARAKIIGISLKELDKMADELSDKEFQILLREKVKAVVQPLSEFVKEMDEAGIEWGVISAETNEKTAEIVAKYPNRFIGLARPTPTYEGMKGVKELERGVKELGLKSTYIPNFRYALYPNDKKLYPLYAKAAELHIPVFIYATMNYSTKLPMDIGHPSYIDEVARDFPDLTIIAALGGWPWVPEMVGLARRHQNIYIDTEGHRPRHLSTPGAGWEMLMQFGNTLLQDRICFASLLSTYSLTMKQAVEEMKTLPLKEEVKGKWLYSNAARIFNLK